MDKVKTSVAAFIFILLNCLYVLKYAQRITEHHYWVAVAIGLLYGLLYLTVDKWKRFINKPITLVAMFVFVIGFSYIFTIKGVETLNVDRWSVISSFWDNFFKGEYVYYAKSHMGNPPGPMPFYYILALPFYLMRELGYFSLLAIGLLIVVLKQLRISENLLWFTLFLLLCSPFYWWEVLVRSNIATNTLMVLSVMVCCLNINNWTNQKLIISGCMLGLVLSTRNVYVIPLIIMFIYFLRNKILLFKQVVIIGAVALLTFALTFVPFVYQCIDCFLDMNPFIVQGSFLIPFDYTIFFIFLSIIFGFFAKDKQDVYFYAALGMFMTILIYMIYHIVRKGINMALYESIVDISYFILAIPFAMVYLASNNQKKQIRNV